MGGPFLDSRVAVGGAGVASAASFVLINDGTHTIYHVYVSRATSDTSEYPDSLGEDVLSPGCQVTINFPGSTFDTCNWDIAVVYSDHHTIYDRNEDLCSYDNLRRITKTRYS